MCSFAIHRFRRSTARRVGRLRCVESLRYHRTATLHTSAAAVLRQSAILEYRQTF